MGHSAGIRHLKRSDPKLAQLIERVGPFRMNVRAGVSPFAALAESIAYQQLNGRAAATIWGRVIDIYGGKKLAHPKEVIKTEDSILRAAGLSANKVLALKDLAEKTVSGVVPSRVQIEKLSDEEIIERLVEVRGIGRWTVEMLMMFTLGRLDILPAGDYGVQQGFRITYNKREIPKPKALLEHGERWRPFRSIASWYLWRAVDLAKEETAEESGSEKKGRRGTKLSSALKRSGRS